MDEPRRFEIQRFIDSLQDSELRLLYVQLGERYRLIRRAQEVQALREFRLMDTAEQARYTCKILEKIRRAIDSVKLTLRQNLPTVYRSELVDFLFSNAYFTQKGFEQELGVSPMTARKYLLELEKYKVVVKTKQTGRNRFLYITPRYINILKQA